MSNISNTLVDRSVPQYIKSEYPYFEQFMSAYYEWLEHSLYPLDIAKNLKNYRNIDSSLDEFTEYFEHEFLNKFPKELMCNKDLLIKNVKRFYLNKGNQQSYKFLFRLLYNEDISFYFPGDDILRASDGKWVNNKIIKILLEEGDTIEGFDGSIITGNASGAVAGIESAISYYERGILVAEVYLSSITGEFTNETVTILENEYSIIPLYTSVNITTVGSGYNIGDLVPIRELSSGNILGHAKISQITKGPITGLNIVSGGINYNGSIQTVDEFYALPMNYTWAGLYLPDQPIHGASTDFQPLNINFSISDETLQGVGDIILVKDSPESTGSGAYGIVSEVDNDGSILAVTLINQGQLYETPHAEIVSNTGIGGNISVIGGGGGVSKATFQNFAIKLDDDTPGNVYVSFAEKGDGNAEGSIVSDNKATYPGYYLNEDGHLSSTKKLQDNYYYQDYSYVIKTSKSVDKWRDFIKETIHPIGVSIFGQIDIGSSSMLNIASVGSYSDIGINSNIPISFTVSNIITII